jgi:hypothetical protein
MNNLGHNNFVNCCFDIDKLQGGVILKLIDIGI